MDGNHKLIKYRFVVHGAMDGFSRLITFLTCSTNNRAATVLTSFTNCLNYYNCPLQIRCDKGGENVDVARFMLDIYSGNPHCVITGSSNHNQRIERSWRDIYEKDLEFYHNMFDYFADDLHYNFTHDINLFVLHYLFEIHIGDALHKFRLSWNKHKLSTEHNRTPEQLFELHRDDSYGTKVIVFDEHNDAVVDVEDPEFNQQAVVVEPVVCPLDDHQLAMFQQHFQPLRLADDHSTNDLVEFFIAGVQYCVVILGLPMHVVYL